MTSGDDLDLLTAGQVVASRYEVLREVGRGGYSVVYAARDQTTDAVVALKVLVPPPTAAASARERMRRELEVSRLVRHSGIVPVHALLEEQGRRILVMEYVPGPDLASRLRTRGPLSVDEVVTLGRQLAGTLEAAHALGIVHRDIKPENVLLHRLTGARLTDFGAACLEGQQGVTRAGDLAGTLRYAAPELLAGARGDARADVYSLGLTLFTALLSHLPERPSPHLPPVPMPGGHHPSRSRGGAHVPDWLDDIVARATAAEPGDRFHTAGELGRALSARGRDQVFAVAAAPPVIREDACVVCGTPNPLGLTLCGPCGGMEPETASVLLFLRRAPWAERPAMAAQVGELLQGVGDDDAIREALLGRRALVRVPMASAPDVLERLGLRGLSGRMVPAARAWAAIPPGFYLLLLGMLAAGILTGLAVSAPFLWATPLVTGLLWFGALRALRTPVVPTRAEATALPAHVESLAARTLVQLPEGAARQLLADILRLARSLDPGPATAELRTRVAPLVASACRAAGELVGLDEHLGRFEAQRRDLADLPPEWWESFTQVETARERLAHHLLQVIGAVGRARQLGADAVDGVTAELGSLLRESRLATA